MLPGLLILLVIVLLVLRPLVQRQRERALAQRLQHTRDPVEAMLVVDTALRASQREGNWFTTLRESYFFWLR